MIEDGDLVELPAPKCFTCQHWDPENPGHCAAFPNGVPGPILRGDHDHVEPYPGDAGIRYQARGA